MNLPLSANGGPRIFFAQASVATRSRTFLNKKGVDESKASQYLHARAETVAAAFLDKSQAARSVSITPEIAVEFERAARYKKPANNLPSMVCLDGDGYLRLNDVLTVYPVSRAAWYEGVQEGIYPAAVKLGRRSVGWSRAAIRELIANPPKF